LVYTRQILVTSEKYRDYAKLYHRA
jgi:hypothetical protein